MNTDPEISPFAGDDVTEALNWRYATKQFDASKKLDDEQWSVLQESLHLAASSFGLQPWKFVGITDPAKKRRWCPMPGASGRSPTVRIWW